MLKLSENCKNEFLLIVCFLLFSKLNIIRKINEIHVDIFLNIIIAKRVFI